MTDYTTNNKDVKRWLTKDGDPPLELLRELHRFPTKVPKDNFLAEMRRRLKLLNAVEVAFLAQKHFPFPSDESEDLTLKRFADFLKDVYSLSLVHQNKLYETPN